jgi:hypothetical protein
MKPVKKKTHHQDFANNDDFTRKPVKKVQNKRDRKPSIYQPLDEEEDLDLDLFNFDDDAIGEDEDDL